MGAAIKYDACLLAIMLLEKKKELSPMFPNNMEAGDQQQHFFVTSQGKRRSGSAPHRRPESTFFRSSSRDRGKRSRSGVHVVMPGRSHSDADEEGEGEGEEHLR